MQNKNWGVRGHLVVMDSESSPPHILLLKVVEPAVNQWSGPPGGSAAFRFSTYELGLWGSCRPGEELSLFWMLWGESQRVMWPLWLISVEQVGLTGDGHVSVCFSFIDDVHDLIRTGNETLRTTLTGSACVLLQNQHQYCDQPVRTFT